MPAAAAAGQDLFLEPHTAAEVGGHEVGQLDTKHKSDSGGRELEQFDAQGDIEGERHSKHKLG